MGWKTRWKLIVKYKAGTSSLQERKGGKLGVEINSQAQSWHKIPTRKKRFLGKQAPGRGMVEHGGGVTAEGRSWKASVR